MSKKKGYKWTFDGGEWVSAVFVKGCSVSSLWLEFASFRGFPTEVGAREYVRKNVTEAQVMGFAPENIKTVCYFEGV